MDYNPAVHNPAAQSGAGHGGGGGLLIKFTTGELSPFKTFLPGLEGMKILPSTGPIAPMPTPGKALGTAILEKGGGRGG